MTFQFLRFFLFLATFFSVPSSATIPSGATVYASTPNQTWSSPNSTFSISFISTSPNVYTASITYSGGVPMWTEGSNVDSGSTLHASDANQSWSSPSSTFSLSFIPVAPFSYVAAITYSAGVTVWSAGDGSHSAGAVVDSGGTLHLLLTGALRLINGSGTIVWDSGTADRGVSHASLDDSGNFQLLNNDSSPTWSSFENPTDTLVPSQNFTVGKILGSGSYSLSLNKIGNLTLKWNNSIEYWNLGFNSSIKGNLTSPRYVLESTGILRGFDPSLSSGMIMAYSTDYGEGNGAFRFLRMDSDGNLRIYSTSKGSGNITSTWAAVTDQCQVFGYCGNMGICSYKDMNPICGCPSQNFELIDVNDSRKGCKRKVEIEDCPGNFSMIELGHAKFLTYPPEVSPQTFYEGILACRVNCFGSGSCIASTSVADGSGSCYMKTPDFVSGYQNAILPSTSFVKVCWPAVPNPSPYQDNAGKDNNSRSPVLIVAVVVLASLLVLVALLIGAPKVVAEGSTRGTSTTVNSNISAFSTYASSSSQSIGVLPFRLERDMGRESSSLLGLERSETDPHS
ncbi:hypothetical protein POUND7_017159 [Theobroma cacao]